MRQKLLYTTMILTCLTLGGPIVLMTPGEANADGLSSAASFIHYCIDDSDTGFADVYISNVSINGQIGD